jgi:hypothetical protein
MTYGRELFASLARALDGAVVSHLAELVRGNLFYSLGGVGRASWKFQAIAALRCAS